MKKGAPFSEMRLTTILAIQGCKTIHFIKGMTIYYLDKVNHLSKSF